MEYDAECTCSHVYDEHRQDSKGVHECTIEDCDCVMFEEAEAEEEEDQMSFPTAMDPDREMMARYEIQNLKRSDGKTERTELISWRRKAGRIERLRYRATLRAMVYRLVEEKTPEETGALIRRRFPGSSLSDG